MHVNGINLRGGLASEYLGAPKEVDEVLNYVPILGAAEDIYTAYKNPNLKNIAIALGSTALDVSGVGIMGKIGKAIYRGVKAGRRLRKLKANTLENNAQRILHHMTVEQKKKAYKKLVKNQTVDFGYQKLTNN